MAPSHRTPPPLEGKEKHEVPSRKRRGENGRTGKGQAYSGAFPLFHLMSHPMLGF